MEGGSQVSDLFSEQCLDGEEYLLSAYPQMTISARASVMINSQWQFANPGRGFRGDIALTEVVLLLSETNCVSEAHTGGKRGEEAKAEHAGHRYLCVPVELDVPE